MTACTGIGNILLVGDDAALRMLMLDCSDRCSCRLATAGTLEQARRMAGETEFDLLLVELGLPDGCGLELLEHIDLASHGEIAVITADPSLEAAVRRLNVPVVEYLLKPVAADVLARLMRSAHSRALQRRSPIEQLGGMVGNSAAMQTVFDQVRRVAPLDVCVFVHGESGTGKELVARAVHDLSGRSGRFVAVNCGAIAVELLSSQLFGHERGSFTGAVQAHAGYFEQAEGGTLFLDEITEMPLALQVYLLRVLESHMLTRVGGTREIAVDVRLIAACNRPPQSAVDCGQLRKDLYYRLLEFPIQIPPLRERREDVPLLAQHFLQRLNARYGTSSAFAPDTVRALVERPWPGNVRELGHVVQRHYILSDGGHVTIGSEPSPRPIAESDGSVRFSVGMTFEDIEREMLLKTLVHCNNNKRQAARSLGITAKTIYNRLLRYRSQGLIGDDLLGTLSEEDLDALT